MSRYIDADHAEFRLQCCGTYHGVIAFDTVKAVLNTAPSIDIVFCKECRYFDGFDCNRFGEPAEYNNPCSDDGNDFCSYGERREP